MYYRPTIQFNKTIFDKEIEYIRKKIVTQNYNPVSFAFYALKEVEKRE